MSKYGQPIIYYFTDFLTAMVTYKLRNNCPNPHHKTLCIIHRLLQAQGKFYFRVGRGKRKKRNKERLTQKMIYPKTLISDYLTLINHILIP